MVKEKMGKGKLRGCVNGVRSKLHSLRLGFQAASCYACSQNREHGLVGKKHGGDALPCADV